MQITQTQNHTLQIDSNQSLRQSLAIIACALLLCTLSETATSGIYRWVDKNGKVHYSDKPPAAQQRLGHSQLDDQARVRQNVNRPKTAEERRQAELAQQKRNREERLLQERQRKDTVLLQTFSSVAEMQSVRDEQLESLARLRQLAIQKKARLKVQLARTEKQLAKDDANYDALLQQQILKENMQGVESNIKRLKKQSHETRSKFAADIARFQELRP